MHRSLKANLYFCIKLAPTIVIRSLLIPTPPTAEK